MPELIEEITEGAPDHFYYHLDKLTPQERKAYRDKRIEAREFLYELYERHRQRESRLGDLPLDKPGKALTPWIDPQLNWEKELDQEAKKGPITSKEIVEAFEEFKKRGTNEIASRMVQHYERGETAAVDWNLQKLVVLKGLNIHDVFLAGTWDADWKAHNQAEPPINIVYGKPADPTILNQVVDLIEDAMHLTPIVIDQQPSQSK